MSNTIESVESVLKHTGPEVEIVLLDNGGDADVVKEILSRFVDSRVILFSIGVNRSFGEANNIGAEFSRGNILVFLNNEVLVTKHWLDPLLWELEQNPQVGAVGPKFLSLDGALEESGAFLDSNGRSVKLGRVLDSVVANLNERKQVDFVSAKCLAIRKKDFLMVGGFNFVYEPGHYEDADLCFLIRATGLSIVYQPESTVHYLERQPALSPQEHGQIEGEIETNRHKFLNRWGGGKSPSQIGISPLTEEGRSVTRNLTVVIFTPFDLVFGGGEKYILSVAREFSRSGYRTIFTTLDKYSRLRFVALGACFGLDLGAVELKLLSEIGSSVDVFITIGNNFYPPVKPMGRINIHHCQFPFQAESETPEQVSRIKDVDVVVVNSEFTRTHYVREVQRVGFPEVEVMVTNPPLSDLKTSQNPRHPKQIISVGRFFVGGHAKNQHLLIEAFRELLVDHPDAQLVLVGGLAPGALNREYLERCLELAEGLPVSFHIDSDPAHLKALVGSSSVYWHAAGFGVDVDHAPELCEHFGISVLEAMGAGVIPIVVGNGGPDEIVDFGVNGFKYQSIHGLVHRTKLVFGLDEASDQKLRSNARNRFEQVSSIDFGQAWVSLVSTSVLNKVESH
jgi:glycosyltransferase involved in cell wall biosynthesis